MQQFDERSRAATISRTEVDASSLFLAKVFKWMTIGLAVTALTAYMMYNSETAMNLILGNQILFFGLILGELGLVFYLSARIHKLSAQAATGLFFFYALLNGLTLSVVFVAFTATSIATTFFIAAGMFGSMAVYGYVTKRDLTGLGSFMFMGLIGIIIASVVNIFLSSNMMSWIISGIGVIVFTGLTAYDVQSISKTGSMGVMDDGEAVVRRAAIMGALRLYLDFINLFMHLLFFLGGQRD